MTTQYLRARDLKVGDLLGVEEHKPTMLILEISAPKTIFNRQGVRYSDAGPGIDVLALDLLAQTKFTVTYRLTQNIVMYRQSVT